MEDVINIVCVFKTGRFRDREYFPEDVSRLHASVIKHLPSEVPYRFYCLTDYPIEDNFHLDINLIRLKHRWPGWWSKIELGRPDLPAGRTLYLDLDTTVVNSLQPILDYPGDLVMFDCRIPTYKQAKFEKHRWVCRYQNATILFTAGNKKMRQMYNRFRQDPDGWIRHFRGDQDLMGEWFPNQPTFPRTWMIKRQTLLDYELHPECIIVTGRLRDGEFRKGLPVMRVKEVEL